MGVDVRWDDPDQTILIYKFHEAWCWDEYYAAAAQEWDLMEAVDHRVDVLVDFGSLETLPPNALTHFFSAAAHVHTNRRWIVLIGHDSVARRAAAMLRQIYPSSSRDIHHAYTLTQARMLVAGQYERPMQFTFA